MSTTYIDNQDLTRVTYTGSWIRGGTPREYEGTVASSTHAGDSLTVSFKGTSITAFGTIDGSSEGVVTTYSVDGAPPANVTAPAAADDTFQQQFWRSPTLSVGQHRLLVTMAKVNPNPTPGEGTVWFDYFTVFDPSIVSATSSGISATSSSSPNVVTVSNNVAVGAIVGGVVGGLFIVFAILLAVILCLRRRDYTRKMQSSEGDITSDSTTGTRRASVRPSLIQPFILGSSALAARENKANPVTITPSSIITSLSSKAMTHSPRGSNGDSSEAPRVPAAGPSLFWGPSPIVVRREENDRLSQSAPSNAVDAPAVDMPPTYTPT